MKNFVARVGSLCLLILIASGAEARVLHSKSSYRASKARSIEALSPMGKDKFVVIAQGGIIEVGIKNQKVIKRVIANGKYARIVRDRARMFGHPVLVINEPVLHISHRLDQVRLINGPTWSALSLMTSLQLDKALVRGTYRYVMLSDPRNYVMVRLGTRKAASGHTYSGVKVTLGRKSSGGEAEVLKKFGFRKQDGYVFDVTQLPNKHERRLSKRSLMLRLQNKLVSDSPVVERLISVQRSTS